ncbi:MAG: flagellar biosynthesis repressor FlbT [Bradyrhizobium sp.]|nr:flagellar biosynthesis repressor FlbT [Bradyrhizobium sp.]
MGLKVELKPGERFIVGESLITNGGQRTRLLIEGDAPILREKDIMTPAMADTPAKRIYLAVQLMYTSRDPRSQHDTYFALMHDLVKAAPSAWALVVEVSNHILAGDMYKALKSAKTLIAYEKGLLDNATRGNGLRQDRETDRKSA